MKSEPIKGRYGFSFEFKLLSNGNLAFIRYKEVDRKHALTNYIHCGLYNTDEEKIKCVVSTLRSYDAGVKVEEFAKSLCAVPFEQATANTVWRPNKKGTK